MGRKLHYHQCFSQPTDEEHVDIGVKGPACWQQVENNWGCV